ncbi:MAG: hypothetical protein IKP00_07495 [Victivallales bacterium]|nr:hypothetical protein [Victivallales bacterium]
MKALENPDSLRDALREKLTEWSCSYRQAGVIFDVKTGTVSNWVNGKSKKPVLLNKAKILLFVAGYLDGFMGWLKQMADDNPNEMRTLCSRLFTLCLIIQQCKRDDLGQKKVASLMQEVDALVKCSIPVG